MAIENQKPTLLTAAVVANLIELGGRVLSEVEGDDIQNPRGNEHVGEHYNAIALAVADKLGVVNA